VPIHHQPSKIKKLKARVEVKSSKSAKPIAAKKKA